MAYLALSKTPSNWNVWLFLLPFGTPCLLPIAPLIRVRSNPAGWPSHEKHPARAKGAEPATFCQLEHAIIKQMSRIPVD
jgi:hypothetical protein